MNNCGGEGRKKNEDGPIKRKGIPLSKGKIASTLERDAVLREKKSKRVLQVDQLRQMRLAKKKKRYLATTQNRGEKELRRGMHLGGEKLKGLPWGKRDDLGKTEPVGGKANPQWFL